MKKDVYALARELGDIVAASRTTLPTLALEVAEAARRGDVDEDDAMAIYETYIKKSLHLDGIDPQSSTMKVNASKLRQIIKCASDRRHDNVALLRQVMELHAKLVASAEQPPRPLYQAMVDVSRDQLTQARALSPTRIVRHLKRKSTQT